MRPAIAEKDFWVCWVLQQLFGDRELREQIVFKGGTTLSKVHKLIDRMSEDIDLVLDWRVLGYGPGQVDPYPEFVSGTRRAKFNDEMDANAAAYIAGTLLPKVQGLFASFDGVRAAVDAADPHNIRVAYPVEFRDGYLRPEILLEIGPRASWLPSAEHEIRPYAADAFPALFAEPACRVVAIDIGRIFWEKATILHQLAHSEKPVPALYSRHCYDLFKLAGSEAGVPGTLRLLPREDQMAEMIFGEIPSFAAILECLSGLEGAVNGARAARG